jgi:PAS domain S-box-containing protein
MSFLSPILDTLPYLSLPASSGWVTWFGLLGLTIYSLFRWRGFHTAWTRREWGFFVLLFISAPIGSLLFGLRFSSLETLPPPGIPIAQYSAAFLPLSALPWTLGGGLIGPFGTFILSVFTGTLRGLWESHNLFTILEMGLLGSLYSVLVRQKYRPLPYRWFRQPILAALGLVPLRALLYTLGAYFSISGDAANRLDYALSNVGVVTLTFALEMLIAGITAQIVSMIYSSAWGGEVVSQPSPAERSLETRFLFWSGTFISVLLIGLLVGGWILAGNTARGMLKERLQSTAELSAQSVPFFLETGQNLAAQLAEEPSLRDGVGPELIEALEERTRALAFFEQTILLDPGDSPPLACYPSDSCETFQPYAIEEAGIRFAMRDVPNQVYSIEPDIANQPARLSFITAIKAEDGGTQRVLISRTNLGVNILTKPVIQSLGEMSELQGAGILLDEDGNILHHPNANMIMSPYQGKRGGNADFYDETAPDGTRQLVYYQPVSGGAWAIVLSVPAQEVQQLALDVALPLSLMILVMAVIALVSLRLGLRVITGSLKNLALEADRISQGQLDSPLHVSGEDEVGQLGRAFARMRESLQARMDELNLLLVVSRGVASTLDMEEAVKPVLEAALASGANTARVALSVQVMPDTPVNLPSQFALGSALETYAHLDDQLLILAEEKDRVALVNAPRSRNLLIDENLPCPVSLMAVALRHKKTYYGVLWVGFDQEHVFTEEDIRFISTLAGHAALAAANANLFMEMEVGRRQLEAILESTPDPVLVTDPNDHFILANRAAGQALGADVGHGEGKSIEAVIQQEALLELLRSRTQEKQSIEITLADGRTYLATASSVITEGHVMGRVCIMRDVTYFKELDALKSEFVDTVSHDLRSPLTMMRGYAVMLQTVGELSELQESYVQKIITGVENMTRLVNNLLDLGRIEFGVDLKVEVLDVLYLLEQVTGSLRLQANQKNITLSLELAKNLPRQIEAEPALLHQALFNLVENAIKYTPENGEVSVRAYANPADLIFEVADTGIGIPPDDLARLFEKFYRGKSRGTRIQRGTGLGLSIVRSIAERHGGQVRVKSEEGKGSQFYLQIPTSYQSQSK